MKKLLLGLSLLGLLAVSKADAGEFDNLTFDYGANDQSDPAVMAAAVDFYNGKAARLMAELEKTNAELQALPESQTYKRSKLEAKFNQLQKYVDRLQIAVQMERVKREAAGLQRLDIEY